jgi:AcrR family transcriptional regulator
MRKVAEKIEYSPTAIYVHFADREELFREFCHQDYARLAEVFQSSVMSSEPIELAETDWPDLHRFRNPISQPLQVHVMTPHPRHELDEVDREVMGDPEKDA